MNLEIYDSTPNTFFFYLLKQNTDADLKISPRF